MKKPLAAYWKLIALIWLKININEEAGRKYSQKRRKWKPVTKSISSASSNVAALKIPASQYQCIESVQCIIFCWLKYSMCENDSCVKWPIICSISLESQPAASIQLFSNISINDEMARKQYTIIWLSIFLSDWQRREARAESASKISRKRRKLALSSAWLEIFSLRQWLIIESGEESVSAAASWQPLKESSDYENNERSSTSREAYCPSHQLQPVMLLYQLKISAEMKK